MNKKVISISMVIVLSITMMAVLFLASETGVYAASKKTVYVVTSGTATYDSGDGSVEKYTAKYTYNKNALLMQGTESGPYGSSKMVYKRNKQGAVTSSKFYNGKNLTGTIKNTVNKKGLITQSKSYSVSGGKKNLGSVTKTSYYGNGNPKKAVTTGKGSFTYTSTMYYRKNGTRKENVYKSDYSTSTTTFDSKGRPIREEYADGSGDYQSKGTITYEYTLDKKGNPTKVIEKDEHTDYSGDTSTTTETTTVEYKYDKHNNILKETDKVVREDGQTTSTTTRTYTYKYKMYKVAKKYLKYID